MLTQGGKSLAQQLDEVLGEPGHAHARPRDYAPTFQAMKDFAAPAHAG